MRHMSSPIVQAGVQAAEARRQGLGDEGGRLSIIRNPRLSPGPRPIPAKAGSQQKSFFASLTNSCWVPTCVGIGLGPGLRRGNGFFVTTTKQRPPPSPAGAARCVRPQSPGLPAAAAVQAAPAVAPVAEPAAGVVVAVRAAPAVVVAAVVTTVIAAVIAAVVVVVAPLHPVDGGALGGGGGVQVQGAGGRGGHGGHSAGGAGGDDGSEDHSTHARTPHLSSDCLTKRASSRMAPSAKLGILAVARTNR